MSDGAVAVQVGPDRSEPARRVLIVDDTPDIRFLVRLVLDQDGRFEVVGEAGDGAEAIEAAGRLQPDVVLLDLAMPVMDGLEALPGICVQSPSSKVVVLSGFNASEMKAEAMSLGAASYLEKGGIGERLVPHILQHFPDRHDASPTAPGRAPPPPAAEAPAATPTAPPVDDLAGEWVSALAHELNGPVTILRGFATMLEQATDSMSLDAIRKSAASIGRAAEHLGSLISAFSDLRKVEVESLDLFLEPTDLSQLASETITDMAGVTTTHPVFVDAVEGAVASVDPPRVRQVLLNLLSNAVKFSPAGARIDVRVTTDASNVEISVRDRGPGIPASKHPALFQKFSRLDPGVPGTGIGLFLSQGIARAHGGDLVLAQSDVTGCEFVLRLPLVGTVEGAGQ